MGRAHSITSLDSPVARRLPVARAVDGVVGAVALALALPLMGVLAIAVRMSSHGPVLHREPGWDRSGRRVELLTYRIMLDGGATEAHERMRAVVGAHGQLPLTGVGRALRATRLERLPRLLNLAAGHISLF